MNSCACAHTRCVFSSQPVNLLVEECAMQAVIVIVNAVCGVDGGGGV